jgi:hypothetical protein
MASLPEPAKRHAVFGERLLGLGRVDAVGFVDALLRLWQSGNVAVQNALLAWALWTIRLRRAKRSSVLDGLRETAAAEGLDLVLCSSAIVRPTARRPKFGDGSYTHPVKRLPPHNGDHSVGAGQRLSVLPAGAT